MIRSCAVCGKAFTKLRSSKYCSEECSRLGRQRYMGLYRAEHTEEASKCLREWKDAHPERMRGMRRKYRVTERGKAVYAAEKHNRRVKVNGIKLTTDIVRELMADFDGFCPYCWEKIVAGHVDHIVPVSKGGTNDRNNLAWVCSTCNMQKGDKSLAEFRLYQKGET